MAVDFWAPSVYANSRAVRKRVGMLFSAVLQNVNVAKTEGTGAGDHGKLRYRRSYRCSDRSRWPQRIEAQAALAKITPVTLLPPVQLQVYLKQHEKGTSRDFKSGNPTSARQAPLHFSNLPSILRQIFYRGLQSLIELLLTQRVAGMSLFQPSASFGLGPGHSEVDSVTNDFRGALSQPLLIQTPLQVRCFT